MSKLFWIGIVMIGYDFLGHFLCLIARITGAKGAYFWNTYSHYIYPSIKNSIKYDLFWSILFLISLVFLILGKK